MSKSSPPPSPPQPPPHRTITTTTLHQTALTTLSLPHPTPPTHPITHPPNTIPHTKLIPKTRFLIDAFKYPNPNFTNSYFLSHFHSDHYSGLTPNWSHGIIYCSQITATLLIRIIKIPEPFIYVLCESNPVFIDGVEVFIVDANHCPGAVQFLFKILDNNYNNNVVNDDGAISGNVVSNDNVVVSKYVHTGDFRYCEEMKEGEVLRDFIGADGVFLDTTYCDPKYVFPSQEESIDYIVNVIEREKDERVLFLVATYVIGKERILLEVNKRLGKRVCVSGKKMEVLRAIGLGESGVFTEEGKESDVHVVGWNVLGETWPYFRPNFGKMEEVMREKGYTRVVGFVPTGWTYEVRKEKFAVRKKGEMEIHLVPYSEHSNFEELKEYVKFLKPKRVIPTVGDDVEKADSKHVAAMRKHFAGLVDERAVKQEFLMGFLNNDGVKGVQREEGDEIDGGEKCLVTEQEAELHGSGDASECEVEISMQEIRDCLPSWVTESQMLTLLKSSGGNVVEAVSKFYEHETEFREEVLPTTSFLCASREDSENQLPLPFDSPSSKSTKCTAEVPLSQRLKLTSSASPKSSGKSPGKRKRNPPNSKGTKKARTGSSQKSSNSKQKSNVSKQKSNDSKQKPSDSKQCSITNFFSKKTPVVVQDEKLQTETGNSNDDQSSFQVNTSELYKEELDNFIQIVNGSESLRSYAATILEDAKGDINMALDRYYRENTVTPKETKENLRESINSLESDCAIISEVLPESKQPKTKPDIGCAARSKENVPGNYISLPPEKYSPREHACWTEGQPAPYIHIAHAFEKVEEEKGKLKATSMLCNMFRSLLALSPEDVLPAMYLCTNRIAPDHENMELNIGGSTVVAALEEVCGTTKSKINNLYNIHGDLGDVAQLCRQTQSLLAPPAVLTIRGVYSVLRKISVQTGSGSTVRKKRLIMNLLCSCREKEMKFLVRTLVRNLRIGAMMRTLLPALAQAIVMNSSEEQVTQNLKNHIQRISSSVVEAYNILPNLDLLIPTLMEKGIEFSSSTLSMVPGVPIKPMLAKITNGAPQVLKLFQDKAFTCEYKYDGQRAQIHKLADGSVRVFSRNGDETTLKFPDVVETVKNSCAHPAVTFILDAEVVAVDRKNGMKLMSFQELSSRERGSKDSLIAIDKIKVDICIFVFDVMFANGDQLLNLPLRQRKKYLKDLFSEEHPGYLEYAKEMTVESEEADISNETTLSKMNSFLDEALRFSCEGIMVKCLDVDAGYTPSKRSDAWLKVKRDYVEGLSDSLDLVPIGAWYGNGRKAGWFSPFLMACYNPDTEEYQSVCRVMSGFSDAFYIELKELFSGDKILSKKPPYYRTAEVPDMWFSPEVVWQIKGADFTISPVHHAAIGLVHPSRGISVRFPRFVRSVTDRKPEDCSTAMDIADMFSSQTRKMDVGVEK